MSITRKLLKGMGLTEEQVDTIIEAHTETVDGLKEQIKAYKADAEKLPGVQRELDDLKSDEYGGYKEKYEKDHKELEELKAKTTRDAKSNAYRALLKSAGISEKYLDTVLRASDIERLELDTKGAIKGADVLAEEAKTTWGDFMETTTTKGARIDTPPANVGGTMSRAQILAIKDRGERRKAIAENMDLFEKGE